MIVNRYIVSFLLLLGTILSNAQSPYVDSLESLLEKPIPDTVKVWALNELGREYVYGSPEKSFQMANEALEISGRIGYKRGQAYSYRVMASLSGTNDRYLSYSEYLEKAIKLFMDLQDSVGLGNCYITEAVVYDRQLNFEQSINSYHKALPIFRNAQLQERVGVVLNNMGFVYYRMDKYEEARNSLAEAVEINEAINNTAVLLDCYSNLGLVLVKLKDLEKAQEYFTKVFQLHNELNDNTNPEAYVETLIGQSEIYKVQGRFNEEKKMLEQAKAYAEKFRYLELLRQTYFKLSEHYLATRDYDKVNEMLKEFRVVDDSITQQRRKNQATIISSVINSAKLESDFEVAQSNLEKQELVIAQQNRTLIIVALVGTLFFVLLVLLFLVNRSRRRVNRALAAHREALDKKNAELEKLNQTKDKFFSVVAHDLRSPLNSLFGFSNLLVKYAGSMTTEEIQTMGTQLRESVSNTLKMTENLIVWARSQMQEEQTNPETLDVNQAIEETFKIYEGPAAKKGIAMKFHRADNAQVYADRNHFHLIIRNIINNAIKYTKSGDQINVSIQEDINMTKIIIEDTGLGMDAKVKARLFSLENTISQVGTSGEHGTGLGLVMCKDFVERNNGSIQVSSEENKGTRFTISLPSLP